MNYQTNPFAPVGMGLMPDTPVGYQDFPALYPYVRSLTASQVVIADALAIDTASDFYLKAIVVATSTGSFSFRYADASRYYTSNSLLPSIAISLSAALPFPVVPLLIYPAGGQIVLDITDTSAAPNAVELWFLGTRRYMVPR